MESYKGYRYPIEIISHAVWCYYRFSLSLRDVEELLLARGISVSYETIRTWSKTWGVLYAAGIKKRQARLGNKWHIDEMQIKISGQRYWLFRAVDEQGHELDILLQARRNRKAVVRFFKKVLKGCQYVPDVVVRDKLKSYIKPCKYLLPSSEHRSHKRLNNRVENAHQPTRRREKQMIRFKTAASANRFIAIHGQVRNLFRVGRYTQSASNKRTRIAEALQAWRDISLQVA